MNYKKIYDQICDRAKKENRVKSKEVYYEAHHIIPRCLGGKGEAKNWKWHPNIVLLTAREHFLCHWLLHRIFPNDMSLLYAFDKMRVISPTHKNNRYIPSSRVVKEITEAKRRLGKSEDFKNLMSKKYLGIQRPKLKCPYCEKIGGTGNMQRWHFDNCLKKHGNEKLIRKIIINKRPKKVKCPHCEIEGASNLMNAWHFDNCPKKLSNDGVRNKIECPHCNVKGGERIMKRWHFDNCKILKNKK
jgi:hypothetical protein